jgi:hypothetical protein
MDGESARRTERLIVEEAISFIREKTGNNMKRSDFWLIVVTGIISGVLLLAGGILATYHHYTGFLSVLGPQIPRYVVYPYSAFSLKLLGVGTVLSLEDLALCLASPPTQTAHVLKTVKRNVSNSSYFSQQKRKCTNHNYDKRAQHTS